MPSKLQMYTELSETVVTRLTGSYQEWTAFLCTAGRLYKYPFPDQMMIYAQRPNATACAEYDFWNEKMRRYVMRGSSGIALIDTSGDKGPPPPALAVPSGTPAECVGGIGGPFRRFRPAGIRHTD